MQVMKSNLQHHHSFNIISARLIFECTFCIQFMQLKNIHLHVKGESSMISANNLKTTCMTKLHNFKLQNLYNI